ncbi:hypothetical protein [Planctomyces sp. SH-PL14]|uniref:hypothetical protein n=1 Tax=Planctomyces sp. SH-PL14 TaxID=1632864 RepID=UPI00078B19AC|nr:hypothetical protein [Planctomyces sp. SH-PL14]AMV20632.1 hypothetical protein VT03_22220 [Planctomyces sp. SH-PL14]
MSWWKVALIVTVVWFVLVPGAAYVHVEVLLSGQLTEEQEEVVAGRYGAVAGAGMVVIWGAGFLISVLSGPPRPKIDQGFCLSWWHLSPRRQFLREFWAGGLCVGLFVALQASGNVSRGLAEIGFHDPVAVGWQLAGVIVAIWVIWVAFLYWRWRRAAAGETSREGPTS